jgi:UDP-N-acetylmuramoylalanine-D-glutamate ligase
MAFSLKKYQSDYSIFTNFKPDHLNWHHNLQEYFDAKMNLIQRTKYKAIINQQIISFAQENSLHIALPTNYRIFTNRLDFRDGTDGQVIKISGRK